MTYEEFEIILAALVDGGTAGVGGWAAGADVINVAALKRDQVGWLECGGGLCRAVGQTLLLHPGAALSHKAVIQHLQLVSVTLCYTLLHKAATVPTRVSTNPTPTPVAAGCGQAWNGCGYRDEVGWLQSCSSA